MDRPEAESNDSESLEALAVDALLDCRHPVAKDSARWAAEHLCDPQAKERDRSAAFWRDGWKVLCERGIIGLQVHADLGGSGADLVTTLLTIEGLGYGCDDAGLVFAAAGHIWTVQPLIERFGSDEQKRRWFPALLDGSALGAFSISEPGSGSDTFSLQTTAEPQDDGSFIVNGTKSWVTLGPIADVFVVFVTTAPERGRWGITALLIERDTPGLEVGPNQEKIGLRTTPFGSLTFTDCQVPAAAVLGRVGAGAAIFDLAMEAERGFMLAGQLGGMLRQLDDTADRARSRTQSGVPIAEHQAVAHRLAAMRLRYETSRALMYQTAIAIGRGNRAGAEAAMTKLQLSEAAVQSSVDAMLTFGAHGVVSESGIEADLRNTAPSLTLGGTSDIQRNIVASSVLDGFGRGAMDGATN